MSAEAAETESAPGRVTLRYWASLRAAAGVDSDEVALDEATSLADLKARARALHDSRRFADVLATCSVLVDDRPAGSHDASAVVVHAGQSVEFLPPFAGG